jgi:disulfide bond formation protein DsbB
MVKKFTKIIAILLVGLGLFLTQLQIGVYHHEMVHSDIGEYTGLGSCEIHIGFLEGYTNCTDFGSMELHAIHEIVSYNMITFAFIIYWAIILLALAIVLRGENDG